MLRNSVREQHWLPFEFLKLFITATGINCLSEILFRRPGNRLPSLPQVNRHGVGSRRAIRMGDFRRPVFADANVSAVAYLDAVDFLDEITGLVQQRPSFSTFVSYKL